VSVTGDTTDGRTDVLRGPVESTNATILDGQVSGTILNDDAAVVIRDRAGEFESRQRGRERAVCGPQ
jgi:hypothetical protein